MTEIPESLTVCKTTIKEAPVCELCESLISLCSGCAEYFDMTERDLICIDYGDEHYHPECWEERQKQFRNEREVTQ